MLDPCIVREMLSRINSDPLQHNMARPPKDFLATGFRVNHEKKAVAPHYMSEPFASALAPPWESSDFFCHIIWRQREGSSKRAKKGKKATPRYMAESYVPSRCINKGFGGICATLSGGNPPRYETNHNR
jgi:hypothetical protein